MAKGDCDIGFQVIEQLGAICYESLDLLMNAKRPSTDEDFIINLEKSIRKYGNAVAIRNASFGHATSTTGSKVSQLIGSKLSLKLELRRHIDGMKRHMCEQNTSDIATEFDKDVSIMVELATAINDSVDGYLHREPKRSMSSQSKWHGQSWLQSENLDRCSDQRRRDSGQVRPTMSDMEDQCQRCPESRVFPESIFMKNVAVDNPPQKRHVSGLPTRKSTTRRSS